MELSAWEALGNVPTCHSPYCYTIISDFFPRVKKQVVRLGTKHLRPYGLQEGLSLLAYDGHLPKAEKNDTGATVSTNVSVKRALRQQG